MFVNWMENIEITRFFKVSFFDEMLSRSWMEKYAFYGEDKFLKNIRYPLSFKKAACFSS